MLSSYLINNRRGGLVGAPPAGCGSTALMHARVDVRDVHIRVDVIPWSDCEKLRAFEPCVMVDPRRCEVDCRSQNGWRLGGSDGLGGGSESEDGRGQAANLQRCQFPTWS